jgi:hypothetical protein
MAAAFGFVEKGLEARTHVSSPSPHLTLLRLIAAVVTPLLDDPSPGSVRPEDRDPSLGAVSDRSRPPALDPDLDHIGFASPRPEATTGNATTTTNTTTDTTTSILVLPERSIASADASLDSAGRLIRGSPEREAMGPRGAETEAGEHRRNTDTD